MAGSVWQGGQVVPYYHYQTAFTAGEISDEVASRVDLDKFQFALLQCKNAIVRPYGPVYKRPGMKYIDTLSGDVAPILVNFTSGLGYDYVLVLGVKTIKIYKQGSLAWSGTTDFTAAMLSNLRFTQSADTMYITSGDLPVKVLKHKTTSPELWEISNYEITHQYFQEDILNTDKQLKVSGTTGTITISCDDAIFKSSMVGAFIQIKQNVASVTKKYESNSGTSGSLYVGEEWKVVSGGTWTGDLTIERSVDDGVTWREYRKYSATNNFNVTESGSVKDGQLLRIKTSISSGSITVNLTALPYLETGLVKITSVANNGKSATATVIEDLGNTDPTYSYGISSWNECYGYPRTCCFFQDRLWFGGTKAQPYAVWYSRTGDYPSFEVEEASGTILDDSAGMINLISRKQHEIKHMLASKDLMIFTEGNEWFISGASVITPSNTVAQMQSARGCNNCEPMLVGNRLVFVQKRGSNVRDLGYSYETDSYDGMDLTMLAEQIIENMELTDCAYKQEPDSLLMFVRSDGKMCCLSYVYEQKVYAWSVIETKGSVQAVCVAQEEEIDVPYVVVNRGAESAPKWQLEAMQNIPKSSVPGDYVMLDSAVVRSVVTATSTFSITELSGQKVDVLADGRCFKSLQIDASGVLTIPSKVKKVIVGLPYTMKLELPNVEVKTGNGTMQGQFKTITSATLRLKNTLGGKIGPDENTLDTINYDEIQNVTDIPLYSGDKMVPMPAGGFDTEGRVYIESDEPYPFDLMMVIRKVSFGGEKGY